MLLVSFRAVHWSFAELGRSWTIKVSKLVLVVRDLRLLVSRYNRVDVRLLLQIEVLEVNLAVLDVGLQWRLDLLRFYLTNIDTTEPRVAENFVHVLLRAETVLLILIQ